MNVNNKKWKNVLKNKIFLTTALTCLIVATVAAAAVVTFRNRETTNDHAAADLNQTEQGVGSDTQPGQVADQEEEPADASGEYQVGDGVLAENETDPPSQETAAETEAAAVAEETLEPSAEAAGEADSSNVTAVNLTFAEGSIMQWPIQGNVIMDFSMDHTVYYATLDQYKVSPGVLIQGEPGTQVVSPANAQVTAIGEDEEIGTYVTLDLGNGYQAKLGNLRDVAVTQGQYIEQGAAIANLAEPTKYYTVEGPNLYFEVISGENSVDPFLYLQ